MADGDVQGMLVRIEATTAQLRQEIARGESSVAQASGKIDKSLGQVDSAFDRAGASAKSASDLIKSALGAAVAAVSVGTIIKTADAYSQMSDRIGLATKSVGEYDQVQNRLLETAKRTYRPLSEAQELYIRTSDSLKSMGYNTGQALDVMDSFSFLLVTNSASADKASSAIDAYSKALQTGKVEADGWQSILAAMPTIVDTIAKSTGKSAEQIRSLGAQGKLSLDLLTQGLQKSATANGLLADSMSTAVRDALQNLDTAFSVYVGRLNESVDFTGKLSSGVAVLADNLDTIAEVAGVAAAGALAVYARSLAVSAAGSVLAIKAAIEEAIARREQSAAVLFAAQADRQKAQTAVFLAQKELDAAKTRISGMAVEKQLAIQLAEARMVEARATAALSAAQAGLVTRTNMLLGFLGGPAGIAMLAIGAATAFLTLRDNTGVLEKKLGDLAEPVDKLIEKFAKLDRVTQSVTLRALSEEIKGAQEELSTAAKSTAFEFQASLTNAGLGGASGFMAGIAPLPAEFQAAADLVNKASADASKGIVVDWKAVADEVRKVPGVTAEMADALESNGASASALSGTLVHLKETMTALTGETDENTKSILANKQAQAEAEAVGQKFIEAQQKKRSAVEDKTAMDEANRFLKENTKLTAEQVATIKANATAIDKQKEADKAATKAKQDASSAATKAATQIATQTKALADFTAKTQIQIDAAKGMAAGYLEGIDKSREFGIQQKIEEELLKTGAKAREQVAAAMRKMQDAQDALDVSKAAFSLSKENELLIAQAKATLQGSAALDAFNVTKAMTIALAGRNIDVGSKEYKLLLEQTKAQLAANKALESAGRVQGITDRLMPQTKLLRDYTEAQKDLADAMERNPEKIGEYQEALRLLGLEYEQNKAAASVWGKFTEGAIDRIDEAFADAWKNIDKGFKGFAASLKNGFKQLLAELAHMAITKPIVMQIGAALGVGGLSAAQGGGGVDWAGLWNKGSAAYSAATSAFGSTVSAGWTAGDGFLGGLQGAFTNGADYLTSMLASTFSSGATATSTAITTGLTQGSTAFASQFGGGYAISTGATGVAFPGAAAAGAPASAGGIGALGTAGIAAAVVYAFNVLKAYQGGLRLDRKLIQENSGALGWLGLNQIALATETVQKVLDKIGLGGTVGKVVEVFGSAVQGISNMLFGGAWQTKDSGVALGVTGGNLTTEKFQYQKKSGGLLGKNKKRTIYEGLTGDDADRFQEAYEGVQDTVFDLFERLNITLNDSVLDGLNVARLNISTNQTDEEIQKQVAGFFASLLDPMTAAVDAATGSALKGYNFEGLTAFVNNLYTVNATFTALNLKLYETSVAGGKMSEQLVALAGGIEAFGTATSAYYENFYTDLEKANNVVAAVAKQFKDLEIDLPDNRDAFRAVIDGLDLTTEAGQKMFATLTQLSASAAASYSILEQRQATYYAGFYTEAENAERGLDLLKKQLKDVGITLPASREGFRDMVDSIDRTTEAGQKMFATLMSMSGTAVAVYSAMEAKLQAAVASALSGVQRAIAAQQKQTTEAYNARVSSLNDMASTAGNNVTALTGISNSLSNALKQLRGTSDDAVRMLRSQAQATLQSALAISRAGGSLAGFEGLEDALAVVGSNNTDLYASAVDFARDQGETANVVAELNALNGKQLTAQQQVVKGIQDQLAQAKAAYDAQMAQFDKELEFAQAQIDALNGVDTSVKSVADAVKAMNASVVAALMALPKGAAAANTPQANMSIVETVYKDVLGRGIEGDAAGAAFWQQQLQSGALSYDELVNEIRKAAVGNGQLPAYATGGRVTGPGTGTSDSILAHLSNGEYVMRAGAVQAYGTGLLDQMNSLQLPAFASGGSVQQIRFDGPTRYVGPSQSSINAGSAVATADLVAEVRALRGVVESQQQMLYQTAKNTGITANRLNDMTEDGLLVRSDQ